MCPGTGRFGGIKKGHVSYGGKTLELYRCKKNLIARENHIPTIVGATKRFEFTASRKDAARWPTPKTVHRVAICVGGEHREVGEGPFRGGGAYCTVKEDGAPVLRAGLAAMQRDGGEDTLSPPLGFWPPE